ncbi:MAG: M16 family metallopeptidase [Planctomycetota bacterium]
MSSTILSHTFPNGLVLVGEPMPWLQSAAFTFLVPAGCVYDPPDRSGLASFTCEMALRGAGSRDSRRFILDLDNLGVERDESVSNGHTSLSGATVAENLPLALSIYADLLRRPHLPEAEMEASRLGLLQELRAVEDEPSQKVMIELRRRHYPEPWGRPSHGEQAAIEAVQMDDVRRFFTARYQPRGAILGVAGYFDFAAIKDHIESLLSDWEPKTIPSLTETAPPMKYQHLPYESNQTQIGIAWSSVPYRHPDYFQAWGAVNALSGGMSARLFTEVREKRGLCYSVYASYHTLRERGAVFCYAGTSSERAQETLDVTLGELIRLSEGIDEFELDRLKARAKSALIMQQESSSARSGSIARDWYHLGHARSMEELGILVDGLTRDSINRYLAENPPGDFTIVTLGPQELEVAGGVC